MDWILLVTSCVMAAISLAIHGLSLDGCGPAAMAVLGGTWQFWMQWLRERSWRRHHREGFSPGTQHLALLAMLGWLAVAGASVWMVLAIRRLAAAP